MRKTRFIHLLSAMLMFSVPALADVVTMYDITFMPDPGGTAPLPDGSFSYDSTSPAFSAFLVRFAGVTFDLTAAANSPGNQGGYPACVGTDTGAAASFDMLNGSCAGSYYEGEVNIAPALASFALGAPMSGCEAFGPCISVSETEFSTSFFSLTPEGTGGTFSIAPEAATVPEANNPGLLLGAVMLLAFLKRKS